LQSAFLKSFDCRSLCPGHRPDPVPTLSLLLPGRFAETDGISPEGGSILHSRAGFVEIV
jgi:hypothetical protein